MKLFVKLNHAGHYYCTVVHNLDNEKEKPSSFIRIAAEKLWNYHLNALVFYVFSRSASVYFIFSQFVFLIWLHFRH